MPRRYADEDWFVYFERVLGGPPPYDEEVIEMLYENEATMGGPLPPLNVTTGVSNTRIAPNSPPVNQRYTPPEVERTDSSGFIRPSIFRNIEGFEMQWKEQHEKKHPPISLTKEKEQSLYNARDKRIRDHKARYKNVADPKRGRREGEYLKLVKTQKQEGMTNYEIVHSEIAFNLENIRNGKLSEILRLNLCPDIVEDTKAKRWDFICHKCHTIVPTYFAYFCNGRLYCTEDVPELEMCFGCNHLQEDCVRVKTFEGTNVMACKNCLARRNRCQMCDKKIGAEYFKVRMCKEHLEHAYDREAPFRHFSWGLKWVQTGSGEIMKSPRMFSCEIEALTSNRNWAGELSQILPKELGLAQDGSVGIKNVSPYGFEVQTPRLGGRKGEELINRMLTGVKTVKPILDSTCGMHIHLDGRGIMPLSRHEHPVSFIQLWKAYIVFEDVILSFLPYMRRRNDYCRPLAGTFQLTELDTIETIVDAEKILYKERTPYEIREAKGHHYHSSRYFGANFNCLLKDGHFEVRYHTGTLQSKKILEWANLHALIMDACAKKQMTDEILQEAMASSRIQEKTKILFDSIGLAENSRQYFRSRQSKFGEKNNGDDEIIEPKPSKKAKPPRFVGFNTMSMTNPRMNIILDRIIRENTQSTSTPEIPTSEATPQNFINTNLTN